MTKSICNDKVVLEQKKWESKMKVLLAKTAVAIFSYSRWKTAELKAKNGGINLLLLTSGCWEKSLRLKQRTNKKKKAFASEDSVTHRPPIIRVRLYKTEKGWAGQPLASAVISKKTLLSVVLSARAKAIRFADYKKSTQNINLITIIIIIPAHWAVLI